MAEVEVVGTMVVVVVREDLAVLVEEVLEVAAAAEVGNNEKAPQKIPAF